MLLRSRTRTCVKWGGLVMSVVVFAAWCVSIPFVVMWSYDDAKSAIYLAGGCVDFGGIGYPRGLRLYYRRVAFKVLPASRSTDGGMFYAFPLWIPLALVAIPTVFLWLRDRRIPAGCCQRCGYDLRASKTRCPECGLQIASEASCENEA